jgi:hypothetical protein
MSSNRCWALLLIIASVFAMGACAQTGGAASPSPNNQTAVAQPAGGACQSEDGPIADGTIVSKCAMPGQGITSCPRYICRRCTNGKWSGEYTCRVQ